MRPEHNSEQKNEGATMSISERTIRSHFVVRTAAIRPSTVDRRQFVQFAGLSVLSFSTTVKVLADILPATLKEQEMKIKRNGTQPSVTGPSEWFTGRTRIDPLFSAEEPARTTAASVTFEPSARTAWHTHPLGQTLIVTSGLGRVQQEGGPIEEIRPGDVVWFPPGVKHWHGASPEKAMTHIAIQEALDGKVVEWMEHVTNAQYGK
jgi:quercetin dioxygenase-like cupin family protein